jgi:hypothetical protein
LPAKKSRIFFNAGEIYCRRHVSGKFSEDIFMPTPDELMMALPYAMNGANADFIGDPDRRLHKKFFTITQKT